MELQCSIIIPAFNRVDLTAQCLRALVANTADVSYEVIIVDNGSTDATPALCAGLGGNATVIRNEENRGFAVACNQGAEAAATGRLAFLNTDTEPFARWLPPALKILDSELDVAAVGMKLLFPDRSVQHAGVVLVEQDDYPTLSALHMPYKVPEDNPLANRRRDVSVVTAASVLIRGEAFWEVGGFDTAYWNGYEDVDLCLALGMAGWRLVYEPASVVMHHESASGPERFSKLDQNVERLQNKWAGKLIPDFVVVGDEAVPHPGGLHARTIAGVGR